MDGVASIATFAGLDGSSFSQSSNAGTMFIRLDDWSERGGDLSAAALSGQLSGAMAAALPEANAFVIAPPAVRSEEHTSELQSLMRISYAVFCLKKKK